MCTKETTAVLLALLAAGTGQSQAAVQTSAAVVATGSQPVHLDCRDSVDGSAPVTWSVTVNGQSFAFSQNTIEFSAGEVMAAYEGATGQSGLDRAEFTVTCTGADGSSAGVPVTVYRPTGKLMIPQTVPYVVAHEYIHGADGSVSLTAAGVVDTLPLTPGQVYRPLAYTITTNGLPVWLFDLVSVPASGPGLYLNVDDEGYRPAIGIAGSGIYQVPMTVARSTGGPVEDAATLTVYGDARASATLEGNGGVGSYHGGPENSFAGRIGSIAIYPALGRPLAVYQTQGAVLLNVTTSATDNDIRIQATGPGNAVVYIAYLNAAGHVREQLLAFTGY